MGWGGGGTEKGDITKGEIGSRGEDRVRVGDVQKARCLFGWGQRENAWIGQFEVGSVRDRLRQSRKSGGAGLRCRSEGHFEEGEKNGGDGKNGERERCEELGYAKLREERERKKHSSKGGVKEIY